MVNEGKRCSITLLISFPGVLLLYCSDIVHKQPPWGIKCKDLDSDDGALLRSSAESLLCPVIGVSLDHHVLPPWSQA